MELSSGRELELQGNDLEDLATHDGFRNDVLRSKGRLAKYLLPVARKYLITDLDWLKHVIETWDGQTPLPSPDDSGIRRSSSSRYDFWQGGNGVLSVETGSYEKSPRMAWRRSLTVDRLASKWLVLRVRLFPGLHASSLNNFLKESLKFAWHRPANHKKSSKAVVAQQFLDRLSMAERAQTNYRLEKLLQKQFQISKESAKKYVKKWRLSKTSSKASQRIEI